MGIKKLPKNLRDSQKSSNFAPLSGTTEERCRSGRSGRSRKPLCLLGTGGSNPSLSAKMMNAILLYNAAVLRSLYSIDYPGIMPLPGGACPCTPRRAGQFRGLRQSEMCMVLCIRSATRPTDETVGCDLLVGNSRVLNIFRYICIQII